MIVNEEGRGDGALPESARSERAIIDEGAAGWDFEELGVGFDANDSPSRTLR